MDQLQIVVVLMMAILAKGLMAARYTGKSSNRQAMVRVKARRHAAQRQRHRHQ
jgi:hypothetical protein